MNSLMSRSQGPNGQRPFNTYGDAVLDRGSQAVFGDVSQNLQITGDLHLHFPVQMNQVAKAGTVIQFLEFSQKFLERVNSLQDQNIAERQHREDIYQINQLLEQLPIIISQLESTDGSASTAVQSPCEIALHELVGCISQNARQINDCLKDQNWDFSAHLFLARQEFLKYWTSKSVDTRFVLHAGYREELNMRLADFLNNGSHEIRRSYHLPNGLRQVPHHITGEQQDDIVEVLSLNHSSPAGLQNAAAILTQRNGQSTPLMGWNSSDSPVASGTGPDRLIRYDLDFRSTVAGRHSNSALPLIEHIPDITALISQILYFREEGDRRIEVQDAHRKTFSWILDEKRGNSQSHFINWLRNGTQCFWVSGKAGSGKSTLMKFIYDHHCLPGLLRVWAGSRRVVVGSFFFWHAGHPLQKSYEGILRALLYQIIEARPDLTPIMFPRLSRYLIPRLRKDTDSFLIPVRELKEALELLTKHMPKDLALFLIIDGVDEYVGNTADHLEFCEFLVRLSRHDFLKVLVSSRPTPACHQIFSQFQSFRLQELTASDISVYIDEKLVNDELFQDMNCLEVGFAESVVRTLTEKASGVFLWIVLVVRTLLIGLGNYDSRETLMTKIDEMPTDLEKLYDYMFDKMDKDYRREGSYLLQLMCHSRVLQLHPMTTSQLFSIIQHTSEVDTLVQKPSYEPVKKALQTKSVSGKIRSRCCGLLEVVFVSARGLLPEPKVDFIHRTVYDYLRSPTVYERLTLSCTMTPAQHHTTLLASCVNRLRYMRGCSASSVLQDLVETFSACLSYSIELSLSGASCYVQYLDMAENEYIDIYERRPLASAYWQAYETLLSYRELGIPKVDLEPHRDQFLQITALQTIARLGLPEYFQTKLSGDTVDLSDANLILGELLGLITAMPADSSATQAYTRNVVSLLRHGVNPNQLIANSPSRKTKGRKPRRRPTRRMEDVALENKQTQEIVGLSPKHGHQNTRAILVSEHEPARETIGLAPTNFLFEDKRKVHRTPWDLWHATREVNSGYLEICLAMVKAGAELKDTKERRKSLKSWYAWIQNTRASSHDSKVIALTTEIMQATGEALAWTSESIPQARHRNSAKHDIAQNRILRPRDRPSPKGIFKTRGHKANDNKFVIRSLRGAGASQLGSGSSVSANTGTRRSLRTRQH